MANFANNEDLFAQIEEQMKELMTMEPQVMDSAYAQPKKREKEQAKSSE